MLFTANPFVTPRSFSNNLNVLLFSSLVLDEAHLRSVSCHNVLSILKILLCCMIFSSVLLVKVSLDGIQYSEARIIRTKIRENFVPIKQNVWIIHASESMGKDTIVWIVIVPINWDVLISEGEIILDVLCARITVFKNCRNNSHF